MPDPRIKVVIDAVQAVVEKAGGGLSGTISPEQLLQLIAACGVDDRCRASLMQLVYDSVEIAARIDREAAGARS